MEVVRGHPSHPCQMVGVEACLGLVVEEGYQDIQAVVVVAEVPSQVRVEGVAVLACQGGVGVVEVLACLVKEVGEEEEEYRHDPVKEEGVVEEACPHGLVGVEAEVEVEGAHLHSDQGEEGQVVEGAHRVLAQEQ